METPGLLGELPTSLRVTASTRAEFRVEVNGGTSLLVGEAAHVRRNGADSVQNWPRSVHVCRKVAAKRRKSGIDRVSIGYRNACFGQIGLTLKNFSFFS